MMSWGLMGSLTSNSDIDAYLHNVGVSSGDLLHDELEVDGDTDVR